MLARTQRNWISLTWFVGMENGRVWQFLTKLNI